MNHKSNEKKSPSIHSLRGWIDTCIGLILVIFVLIGGTGKTYVGSCITYVFAFLFGMFYPFALALIAFFGIHLAITRHFFSGRGQGLYWVGGILTFLALLAFASYSIFSMKDEGVDFISLNSVYLDKMASFSKNPWQIDSYESLSGLGGGYLGLFLLTLLGSIFGKIGDAIFFSFLLILGIGFLSFNPICHIVAFFKQQKVKKVNYSSPYQPNKEKNNPHLKRSIFVKKEKQATISEAPKQTFSANVKAPLDNSWSKESQGSFSSSDGSIYQSHGNETYEDNISSDMNSGSDFYGNSDFESSKQTSYSNPPVEEESIFTTSSAKKQSFYQNIPPLTQKESSPSFEQTAKTDAPLHEEDAEQIQSPFEYQDEVPVDTVEIPQAEDDSQNFDFENPYSKQEQPMESKQEDEKKSEMKNESFSQRMNPLDRVNPSGPLKTAAKAEYKVESVRPQPVEEPPAVQKQEETEITKESQLSQEEIEKQKEQEYFMFKQKQKADILLAKKREKDEKIASLMRYVSDVPKEYFYNLPNDSLLEEVDDSAKMEQNSNSAQEKATIINRVLDEFQVKAKATSFTIGASVTRFNVETEHGEKADKIANLTKEIQIALNGDMSVRVETVVEGRSTSGIEVGNVAPMAVSFKDMFTAIESDHQNLLLLPIGKDVSGNVITFPLNKMPHLLVAGTTGSGKSVLIHSFIMTLIMRTYPSQCKLMLIDPKQVEFVRYQDCPHLMCPVISKPESAVLALKKLCDEMDRRFSVLSKCKKAQNIEAYNQLRIGHESEYEEMPYIVTVIDEFADLVQTAAEATKYVSRIAQKARACGIHLIVATQRPSKDNVPMTIKANIACRIGLSCSSQIDSRVILDEGGAETLLGKGDLLFKCPGKKSLIRAQSPFVSDKDIDTVLEYVKKNAGDPNYLPDFIDLDVPSQEEEDLNPEGNLYSDIKGFVIHTGITSKASLMRSFQISSMKADQFMARLQSESIIALGPNGKYVLGPAAHLEDFE